MHEPSCDSERAEIVAAGVCQPEQALQRLGGMADLYADVLGRFLDDTAGTVAKLRAAVDHADSVATRDAAHSIRGLAAMCGAVSVSEVAGNLEQAARALDERLFSPLRDQLEAELHVAATILGEYR